MRLKLGLLVVGTALGAMFWALKPVYVFEVEDMPIAVKDRATFSVSKDAVSSVFQAFSKDVSAATLRDPFVGTWTGDCGDLVQCALKIKMVGKTYALELNIADWKNADKVVCQLNGSMHISDDKQLLAGTMGSSPLSGAFLRGAGAIELHDMPGNDCSQFYALDGIYRILGD
jgi:hypothetical protein